MIGLIFTALLMVQQAPAPDLTRTDLTRTDSTQLDSVEVNAKDSPLSTMTDQTIIKQLNALLISNPDKVVCMPRASQVRTRLTKTRCASLREWYDLSGTRSMKVLGKSGNSGVVMTAGELDAPIAPPYELVDYVKTQVRNPRPRALAEARARARFQAASSPRAASAAPNDH